MQGALTYYIVGVIKRAPALGPVGRGRLGGVEAASSPSPSTTPAPAPSSSSRCRSDFCGVGGNVTSEIGDATNPKYQTDSNHPIRHFSCRSHPVAGNSGSRRRGLPDRDPVLARGVHSLRKISNWHSKLVRETYASFSA